MSFIRFFRHKANLGGELGVGPRTAGSAIVEGKPGAVNA
jgi:hypothetical protein